MIVNPGTPRPPRHSCMAPVHQMPRATTVNPGAVWRCPGCSQHWQTRDLFGVPEWVAVADEHGNGVRRPAPTAPAPDSPDGLPYPAPPRRPRLGWRCRWGRHQFWTQAGQDRLQSPVCDRPACNALP